MISAYEVVSSLTYLELEMLVEFNLDIRIAVQKLCNERM